MSDILIPDIVVGALVAYLIVSIVLFIRIRSFLGAKYFLGILKTTARRFRNPIQRCNIFQGNYYEFEIIEMENSTDFDKQVGSTPVTINEDDAYRSPGPLRTYFFVQNSTTNINPLTGNTEKLYQILRRIGLLNDKYLDYREARLRSKWADKLLDKEHFNKVSVINILLVVGCLFLLYNLTQFANGATALYNEWLPIIQTQLKDVPRLVADSGLSVDSITKTITGGQ